TQDAYRIPHSEDLVTQKLEGIAHSSGYGVGIASAKRQRRADVDWSGEGDDSARRRDDTGRNRSTVCGTSHALSEAAGTRIGGIDKAAVLRQRYGWGQQGKAGQGQRRQCRAGQQGP